MKNKRFSSSDRHKQLANIAAALFAKKGFNGVTTREIARKAKVNEAILFRHYPTKEALYTAIINEKIHIKLEVFNIEAAEKNDDAEVFRSVAHYLIKQVEEDNTFMRLMLFSALEDHRLSSLFFKERTSILFDFLVNYINKRIGDGHFKKMDPRVIVRAFIGIFFHFILTSELFRMPKFMYVSKEEALDKFVEIFLEGVKKR